MTNACNVLVHTCVVALFDTTVQPVDEIHVRRYHDFVVEELSSFTACSAQLENLRVREREVAASFNGSFPSRAPAL